MSICMHLRGSSIDGNRSHSEVEKSSIYSDKNPYDNGTGSNEWMNEAKQCSPLTFQWAEEITKLPIFSHLDAKRDLTRQERRVGGGGGHWCPNHFLNYAFSQGEKSIQQSSKLKRKDGERYGWKSLRERIYVSISIVSPFLHAIFSPTIKWILAPAFLYFCCLLASQWRNE